MNPETRSENPARPPRGVSPFVWLMLAVVFVAAAGTYLADRIRRPSAPTPDPLARVEKLREESERKMREELAKEGSVSAKSASETLGKYQEEFARGASADSSTGKQMKVMAEFTGEMQREIQPYTALLERIEREKPLDFSTVRSKEDLAGRRELAREVLRLNARLRALAESGPDRVRAGLQREGLSQAQTDSFIRGFSRTYNATLPAARKARQAEEDIAHALLELCDLLESEWGRWTYRDGAPIFQSQAAAAQCNTLFQRVNDAAKMQADAQREALEINSTQR
jgi:hypothetical protein